MQNDQKPSLATTILGCTSGIFIVLGTFFKLMHWPGAAIMQIIGFGAFGLFYLPLWFISEVKQGRKLYLISQFLILFLGCIASLFKTMHWPGGGVLFNIALSLTLFIGLPVFIFLTFRASSKSVQKFHLSIIFLLLVSLIIGGISGTASRMTGIANSFSKNTTQLANSLEKLYTKNKQLYHAFDEIPDKLANPYYLKSLQVKQLTDSTERYLIKFRNHLVALNERVSEAKADSMTIKDMMDVTNSQISTAEICGWDDYKPISGKFTGLELKAVIENFRDSILNFASQENQNFIKAGMNLETEPLPNEHDGEPEDWVFATFKNVPISAVLLTLETMRYEIKNAETQVVTDLLNSTKQNLDNLAVKMADLGAKLEAEKKKREIEKLKSERALSQISMDTKNMQLDVQKQTIVWFIVGFLGCAIMLFFIIRSNLIRKKINLELQSQKQIIETKNKEITDSINYAKRIQQAILPSTSVIYTTFKDSFLLYKPKDVVSGDFYSFIKRDDYVLIAIADCTGHGVPGAFMSMIGNEQLSKIIIEKGMTKPSDILNELHSGVRKALNQDTNSGETRDGMDIALCKLYIKERKLEYSGAMRPLWIIRNASLIEIKADKQPIGGLETENRKPFTNHVVTLEEKDCIYLFTDGYADQFGGEKGKKFMVKNLERLLSEIHSQPMQKQQEIVNTKFEDWKANNEQVDDVLILGIKV